MGRAAKRAGLLVTLSALMAVAVPGTAAAVEVPKWVEDPSSCTDVTTVDEQRSGSRFLQLRRGWCGRDHYVWARANDDFHVELHIYRGNEKIGTNRTQNGSGDTHYTQGRRVDSDLRFRGHVAWSSPVWWP